MKRKLLFIGMFLLFSTATAFAQIEKEIDQSKSEQIRKGREYLLEKFLDRDYDKVKEIKDYLLGFETDDYKSLALFEFWHILFWTQEFDALTESFRQVDSTFAANQEKTVIPPSDQLREQLYRRSVEDEHLLRFNIQEAHLPAEDEAFLNLYLDWDLKPTTPEYIEKCNELADAFLAQYPNSDYEWFVRHIIRKVFVDKNWGWGMGMDLCSGLSTGTFSKPIGGVGLSLDVFYRKFDFMLGYEVVFGKTVVDVPYAINSVPKIYPKGSHSNTIVWYATLAYPVLEKKRLRLAPFVGIGGVADSYPDDKVPGSNLKNQGEHYWTGNAGLCFDIKGRLAYDVGMTRIKYMFSMTLPNAPISTMHTLSVGWTYVIRGKERKY